VKFVDDYCQGYQPLLPEVRIFEAFKNLPIGRLPDIKRKLLPAIAIFGGARSGKIITPLSHGIPVVEGNYNRPSNLSQKLNLVCNDSCTCLT
jgi:hypothetical protein